MSLRGNQPKRPLRFELSDDELALISDARAAPVRPIELARLLARSPSLALEAGRAGTAAVLDALSGNNALQSLISAERARAVVPDAATGVGWYPERGLLDALDPLLHDDLDVLELGCGAGRVSRQVAPRVRHLTCTDVSQAMIHEARRNLSEYANVRLLRVDGFMLAALPDHGFGLVFAAGMFGYIDPAPALGLLDEVRRVLSPGGTAVFNLELIDNPESRRRLLGAARDAGRKHRVSGTVERPYCLAQIEAWLRTVGLAPVSPSPREAPMGRQARVTVIARAPAGTDAG